MGTRVKYDLLPEGMHSFVYEEDPTQIDPIDGLYVGVNQKDVQRNAIVEVEDLNDPKSRRAQGIRQHLEGIRAPGQSGHQPPIARILEQKPKKAAAAAASSKS